MKSLPNNPSESFRRRNPNLYRQFPDLQAEGSKRELDPKAVANAVRRLRQDTKPLMNGLEQAWFDSLKINGYAGKKVYDLRAQSLRFRLGNGIWYKPDVTCLVDGSSNYAFECKGPKAFRGGFENLKVAAGLWPDWTFVLVWRVSGRWLEQRVLP
ncbi:MAG: hypothetical protein KGL39_02770 [Patescibacteria group bacterium]|nr:hypothetical protein [Patescibacteria group bacterium]